MIIIEYTWLVIKNLMFCLMRFPYWLITAKDCTRCKHSCTTIWGKTYCGLHNETYKKECINSITKPYF